MAKGLTAAKVDLQKELYDIFEKAYNNQCSGGEATADYMKKQFQDMSKKYADTLSKGMALAIFNFAMEMLINATVAGTIVAPSGPCTGAIPFTGFVVS